MANAYLQEEKKQNPQFTEEYLILKSIPEDFFSEILFFASQIFKTPAAGIVLYEEGELQVKAAHNLSPSEVLSYKKLIHKTLFIQGIYFQSSLSGNHSSYAGIAIETPEGINHGVLFVLMDAKTQLSKEEQKAMNVLAGQVVRLVEFGKQKNEFGRVKSALEQKYHDLEKFASIVSHDIKSPLANIISLTELLKEENKEILSQETVQYLDFLEESSMSLRNYVDGLLRFYRSEKILQAEEEDVELGAFFFEITSLYTVDPNIDISYPNEGVLKRINKAALSQIFLNLLSNALKYNMKECRQVKITFTPSEKFYVFGVKDNGNGIPQEKFDKIFDLFTTLEQNDRSGNPGSGIGLATVKKLVENMGGEITVESEEGNGSLFVFKIKR